MNPSADLPPRVPLLREREILNRPRFREALAELAARGARPLAEAREYAATCLEEMAVHPEERQLDRVARLARFVISRSYDSVLDVNRDRLAELKHLSGRHPLIFLWSHKSHLDSFVFMRTLYEEEFRPQPLSFAGINMNFPVFGPLAKRSGAIFLRRSFRNDDIYRLVFRHYVDYLVERRLPLSWSIEGTRSRTGKLNPPKLGLFRWVVEACHRNASADALLVPVSISFDQIAEIDDYSAMQKGLPKRRESLGWFLGYIRGMQAPCGRIHVRFAEPLALSDSVDLSAGLFDPDSPAERVRMQKLAFEVCNRIEHATPISGTDLLTLVLLGANGRALTEGEVRAYAAEVLGLVESRNLPRTSGLPRETAGELPATLGALARTGLLEAYKDGTEPVWRISPGKELAAAYYRNTIVHYFLASAVAELALAATIARPADDRAAAVRAGILGLRDLLKFEFFFTGKAAFVADAAAYLDSRYPGWQTARAPYASASPMFGHSVLRSFVEAYHVLANVLVTGDATDDDAQLSRACMAVGGQMLRRRQIGSESALSGPLFANALRLARHRGLVGVASGDAAVARREFLAGTQQLTAALALLQRRYDRAIESTIADGSRA